MQNIPSEHSIVNRLLTRRDALRLGAAGIAGVFGCETYSRAMIPTSNRTIRFGITADLHIGKGPLGPIRLKRYVSDIKQWKPDFLIDLGDFACPSVYNLPREYPAAHEDQLTRLRESWTVLSQLSCPAYIAMGNHCVGWINGGSEIISPDILSHNKHNGEDITKEEFVSVTKMPGRYYSFDLCGYHFIVLDANNSCAAELTTQEVAMVMSHDGPVGEYMYYIDNVQRDWLAKDLKANRNKRKLVFCHQELHFTPLAGSPEGGQVPFPQIGNPSYVGNGWIIREMFRKDGNVLACFHGHKHGQRWTVLGGTHYITLGEPGPVLNRTGREATYAKVTVADKLLLIEGEGKQKSYRIPVENTIKTVHD